VVKKTKKGKRGKKVALYRYSDVNTYTDNLTLAQAQDFQRKQNGGTITPMDKVSVQELHQCQNCGKTFTEDQLAEITHGIWERVSPGEIMPSGECPKCGALCHPAAPEPKKPYVLITVSGGIADVVTNDSDVDVDILDFDNLKDHAIGGTILSQKEWDYLKEFEPRLYRWMGGQKKNHTRD
jgi:hypothetical protein